MIRGPKDLSSTAGSDRRCQRGQSLVEFALLLPVFMVLLLGLLEFGFVFAHHQGLEYATREGARTGAALSNGQDGQNGLPVATTCTKIDDQIIAAVQRVLDRQGLPGADRRCEPDPDLQGRR